VRGSKTFGNPRTQLALWIHRDAYHSTVMPLPG
jgi:hypothetical protein